MKLFDCLKIEIYDKEIAEGGIHKLFDVRGYLNEDL
jgi:hypothetical protein